MKDLFTYEGRRTREISFPLGGIGSGCIGLAGNGELIDAEIFNRPNKGSHLGFTHFAVKAERDGEVLDARVLRGDEQIKFVSQFADEDTEGEYEYISEYGTQYDPAIVSGIAHYHNTGHMTRYGVGQNVFRIDVRKKVLGYGKYPDDIGPEYFIPEDQPGKLIAQAGWSPEELENAVKGGSLYPGRTIHRAGEHSCAACTIVPAGMVT